MLVFVPQGFVALVYEGGALRAVFEAGVGFIAHAGRELQVQFVDLQQQQQPDQEAAVIATLH